MNESSKKAADWVHRIILPCAEVTNLLSDPSEHRLSRRERIALRVHLVVCRWCSRYKRQLNRLRIALHQHPGDAEAPYSLGLSSEARERIRRSLDVKGS